MKKMIIGDGIPFFDTDINKKLDNGIVNTHSQSIIERERGCHFNPIDSYLDSYTYIGTQLSKYSDYGVDGQKKQRKKVTNITPKKKKRK